ncbi:MAG: hypothetical protein FJ109_17970 [Deltaproteobacteria bacterium]|nr:hypothetical protein [Deltaproteobacteria bacterium]
MKAMTVAAWKWIVVAALVAAVGLLLLFGFGRKRGTRTYRWRMAMWTLALSLMGGIGLISLGATMSGCDKESQPSCYAAVPPDTLGQDVKVNPDAQVTCYEPPWDAIVAPDVPVLCYAPRPPDTEVTTEPDTPVMCYEPILDVKPDGTTVEPEMVQTCYLIAIDALPQDADEPDMQVTCYAPVLPDWIEQDVKPEQKEEDIQIMCYDPALPEDTK